ncbi:MAG: hypothetical protein WCK89_07035 [bacterium]
MGTLVQFRKFGDLALATETTNDSPKQTGCAGNRSYKPRNSRSATRYRRISAMASFASSPVAASPG